LVSILIQNGSFEENLVISGNPSLNYICADASEIEFINQMLAFYNIQNCTVDTLCNLESQHFEEPVAIKLYPNPVSDKLNIQVVNVDEVNSIQIFNSLGQLVQTIFNSSEAAVDVNNFQLGVYFIKIDTQKGIYSSKFVKN
jgi:hypothetical protein